MSLLRTYCLGLVATVLVFAQGFAVAHAATYGDAPHDHDGVICDLAVLEDDAEVAMPPPAPNFTPLTRTEPAPRALDFASAPSTDARPRAPPVRGPPQPLSI